MKIVHFMVMPPYIFFYFGVQIIKYKQTERALFKPYYFISWLYIICSSVKNCSFAGLCNICHSLTQIRGRRRHKITITQKICDNLVYVCTKDVTLMIEKVPEVW